MPGGKCQFGSAYGSPVVNATIIATDKLVCISPSLPPSLLAPLTPIQAASFQHVYISLNGYADARTLIGRRNVANATVNATAQSRGGGTAASVGGGARAGNEGDSGVAGDGSVATSEGVLSFRYDTYPRRVLSVHPLGGPVSGGSTLTLTSAAAFEDDGGVICLFGLSPPLQVEARITDAGHVQCYAPSLDDVAHRGAAPPGPWCAHFQGETAPCADEAYAADGAMAIRLDVTFNGNISDATGKPVAWLFFGVPPIEQLQYALPNGGPPAGGTEVELVGYGLLDYVRPTHSLSLQPPHLHSPPISRFSPGRVACSASFIRQISASPPPYARLSPAAWTLRHCAALPSSRASCFMMAARHGSRGSTRRAQCDALPLLALSATLSPTSATST